MQIQTRKITSTPKAFEVCADGLCLAGEIYAKERGLFCIDARLQGELELICDRSGEPFMQAIDEMLVLYISDGFWDTQSQRSGAFDTGALDALDVIECFDGLIDLDSILQSEIESIKLDYHYKGEYHGSPKETSK